MASSDVVWNGELFEDESWKEDRAKEQQRAEIQAAVQQFLRKGKEIQVLPPQPERETRRVSTERWGGAYEDFSDMFSSLN
jgi:hypothetical protein